MALIEKHGSRLVVTGPMTMETACVLLEEGKPLLRGDVEVDLGGVADVDSASISLMFEWLRHAHAENASVVYANLPQTLESLATLYDVLDLIPRRTAPAH